MKPLSFRHLVARLRVDFPTKFSVTVRRRVLKKSRAKHYVTKEKRVWKHFIVIDKRDKDGCCESLFHEWAHCLRWEHALAKARDAEYPGHDNGFWRLYGRMYRKYVDSGRLK